MNAVQARMILPGWGDLKEFVNGQLEKVDLANDELFTDEMAHELLEEIVSWIADDEEPNGETHRSTT